MKTPRFSGAAVALALSISLTACSEDTTPTTKTSDTTAAAATSSVAPNSETALRTQLAEFYKTVPQHQQWDKAHTFLSPRCQKEVDADVLASAMKDEYGPGSGRDFSGSPEYLITMNGDTATVVSKSYDGKGTMQPQTWTVINGRWTLDSC